MLTLGMVAIQWKLHGQSSFRALGALLLGIGAGAWSSAVASRPAVGAGAVPVCIDFEFEPLPGTRGWC